MERSFWQYKVYADIRGGSLEELCPKRPQTKTAKTKTATAKSIHQNGEHVNK